MPLSWLVDIPPDECLRRVKAADRGQFAFMSQWTVSATIKQSHVRLSARYGYAASGRRFMTSLRTTFVGGDGGKTLVSCKVQLHWFVVLFFCVWFGALIIAGAALLGAILFGPVKPPMNQVAPSAGILLAMIAGGGGFFALFRYGLGAVESAYLVKALSGALKRQA